MGELAVDTEGQGLAEYLMNFVFIMTGRGDLTVDVEYRWWAEEPSCGRGG